MKLISGLFLLSAVFFMSCGDGVPKSTTTLTESERSSVLNQILEVSENFEGDSFSTTQTGKNSGSVSGTDSCSIAGEIVSTGQYEVDVKTVNTNYTGTAKGTGVFTDCTLNTSAPEDLVLNGTLDYNSQTTETETSWSLTTNIKGSLNVKNAEAEDGVCGVQLEIKVNINQTTYSVSVTGTICGEEVVNGLLN